jgi:hypothetical protein
LLLALSLVMVLAATAWGHVASTGYVDLESTGSVVRGRADLAVTDLHLALDLDHDDDGRVTWAEVKHNQSRVREYLGSNILFGRAEAPCPVSWNNLSWVVRPDGNHVAVDFAGQCPSPESGRLLTYRAIFAVDAQHHGIVSDIASDGLLVIEKPDTATLGARDSGFAGFVRMGAWHIWIGIDHLFFLLALLLPAVFDRRDLPRANFRDVALDVAQVVTAFTLAHSITLVIATMGWLMLPMKWIEVAIALSVAMVAANNLVHVSDARWAASFALGLLHGFGFSSVLAELPLGGTRLSLALLGFNLGVELGQVAIVLGFLPLGFVLRRTTAYKAAMWILSALMFAIAIYWSVERSWS